jgi:hypothetical protein
MGVGLLVALLATVSLIQIFVTGGRDRSQTASARQFIAAAGRIEPEYIDEPTAVATAPEPIAITQRWQWSFVRSAATDVLQSGHSLTLYKDPENGTLRGLKYNLDERVAVRAQTYGNGVIRSSQELITYLVRPVAVAFHLRGNFWQEAARHDLPQPIARTVADAFKDQHPVDATAHRIWRLGSRRRK